MRGVRRPLQPFVPGGGEVGIIEGESTRSRSSGSRSTGPFDPTGAQRHAEPRSASSSAVRRPRPRSCRARAQIVATIARAAFRRPVTDADLAAPLAFYAKAGAQTGDFDAGIRSALIAVLASPKFLYRVEPPPADRAPGRRLPHRRLRARLAAVVLPVEPACRTTQLLARPSSGKLHDPAVLEAQVERMLADPRAAVARHELRGAVARRRNAATTSCPDPVLFPDFDARSARRVRARDRAVRRQHPARGPQRARPAERATTRSSTNALALHYGIPNVRGDQFRARDARGSEPLGPARQGRRADGHVVSEPHGAGAARRVDSGEITGTPPASPPPNVPALKENQAGEQPRTVRERLEQHRAKPACIALPRRHGSARLRAGELRRRRRVARHTIATTAHAIDASGQLATARRSTARTSCARR